MITFDELTSIIVQENASDVIRRRLDELSELIPELKQMEGFDQQSIYHNLDMLEHTLAVLDNIPCDKEGKKDVELSYAALFHDSGKPDAFFIGEDDGHGHMEGHPTISARIFCRVASDIGIPDTTKERIVKLILYHDTYVNANEHDVREFGDTITFELMEKLFVLQRADILAHSKAGQGRLSKLEAIMAVVKDIKVAGS